MPTRAVGAGGPSVGRVKEGSATSHAGLMRRAAVYLTLTTISIAQPLLQLYGSNVAVFAAANYEGPIVVVFGLLVVLGPPLVLLAVDLVVSRVAGSRAHFVHLALVFLALWTVVSVVLRSVSFGPWIADASFTFAVAAAIAWAYARVATVRSWLATISPLSVVVLVLFVVATSSVISPPDAKVVAIATTSVPGSPSVPGTPKDDVSILWIVLDEAPLVSIMNKDGGINANRFPGFAALAASSTWYRNVVATSQTTTDAVPAMLSGRWPKGNAGPVLANHPRNLFTLMNGHISMDAHEVVTALCPRKVCSKYSVSGGDGIATANTTSAQGSGATTTGTTEATADVARKPLTSFLHDALVVMGHKILPARLRDRLPAIDESWGGFGAAGGGDSASAPETTAPATTAMPGPTTTAAPTEETVVRADPNTVRLWEEQGPLTQIPVLNGVVDRATKSDRPTLHFVHVLMPHRPWVLAPDMRISDPQVGDGRPVEDVDSRRDRYQVHLAQYAAVDSMIGDMVAAMKKSGNWNRTMIVVTADHGLTFEPGLTHREKIDVSHPESFDDIYRVPLFVKYPDQQTGTVDDCTASSVDILPTVIAATGIDAGWKLDGADLRSACPARTSRTVAWPKGSYELRSGVSDLLERVVFYDKWVKADGNVADIYRTGLSGRLIGTKVPAAASIDTGLGWKLRNAEWYQRIGTGRLAPVVTRSTGELYATRNFTSTQEGLIVVDGTIVGTMPELAGVRKGTTVRFTCIPDSSLLLPGSHTVELWSVDMADPSAPVFARAPQ